ncbi:hypothetical protein IIB51_02235 [Patescibacteria group bacterium]|nr:hypothetical protein [Patescibacteria group bacterium]
MMDILHVLDVGNIPLEELASLVHKLNQERRVVGVWYRPENEWDEVIIRRRCTVFDRDNIVEEVGKHRIRHMILLVPEVRD